MIREWRSLLGSAAERQLVSRLPWRLARDYWWNMAVDVLPPGRFWLHAFRLICSDLPSFVRVWRTRHCLRKPLITGLRIAG